MHDRTCNRGPQDLRPVLQLHADNPGARGVLVIPFENDLACQIPIDPRHVLVLRFLVDAWLEDEKKPEHMRGYRSNSKLGEHLRSQPHAIGAMKAEVVRNYVSDIRRAIKVAVALEFAKRDRGKSPPFDLVQRGARNEGYRIGERGLEVKHY